MKAMGWNTTPWCGSGWYMFLGEPQNRLASGSALQQSLKCTSLFFFFCLQFEPENEPETTSVGAALAASWPAHSPGLMGSLRLDDEWVSIPSDMFEHIYSTVTATKCQNKACLLQPVPNEVSTEWQPDSCDASLPRGAYARSLDGGWQVSGGAGFWLLQVPTEATLQLMSPSYCFLRFIITVTFTK